MKSYNVKIHFLNMDVYLTRVIAANGTQAKFKAIEEHRKLTGCSVNEMYNNQKTTASAVINK